MRIKAVAVSILACALVLSCASSPRPRKDSSAPPVISPRPHSGKDTDSNYRKAEVHYSKGRYQSAAETYMRFIASSPPDHPLADNAYFKIGMCWFEMKRYKDALYFFNTVMNRFPKSESYSEAMVNSAIAMFHLGDLDGAEKTFDHAISAESHQGTRAYILFYKGSIAEKRGELDSAARFFIQSGLLAQNDNLLSRAKQEVDKLLSRHTSVEQLLDIRSRYKEKWPAGIALLALIKFYASTGQDEKLTDAQHEYSTLYADMMEKAPEQPTEEDSYRPKSIKIGVSLPLTGPGSAAGVEMIQGIQLALNSFLSLMKAKNIQLVLKDSGLGPEQAQKGLIELAEDKDTLAIIGPAYSDEFKGASAMADNYRISMISPSATEEGVTSLSNYLFRTTLTNRLEAKKMAALAVERMGLKKFVIIYAADRHGRELSQYFTYEVAKLGGEVVMAEAYLPEQTDFGSQIRTIGGMTDENARSIIMGIQEKMSEADVELLNGLLEAKFENKISAPKIVSHKEFPLNRRNFLPGLDLKYDAIYLPGMPEKVGLILPELEFYNIKGIPRLSSSSVNHESLVEVAEKYADGLVFLDGFHLSSHSPMVRSFVKDYIFYFRSEPSILAAQAYDAAVIVLSALAQGAGSRYEVTRHIRTLYHFEGVTGEMNMTAEGDMDKSVIFLTVEGGSIVEMVPPPPVELVLEEEKQAPTANMADTPIMERMDVEAGIP